MAPRRGWWWLGAFWGLVVVVLAGGAATLQWMGPPAPAAEPVVAVQAPTVVSHLPGAPLRPGWDGRIAAPDPALLEPARDFPPAQLPRVGADGRMAMQVYARPADRDDKRPKVAILLSGFGLSEADSRAALMLPGPVGFAVTLYRPADPLVEAARASGHELFASIPMESDGYPRVDAGSASLMTGAAPDDIAKRLERALSHVQGAVGATGASDGFRGERFAAAADAFSIVPREVSHRGLMYVDPRPGAAVTAGVAGRPVDLVLDEPPQRAEIDAKLRALETRARERGSALGLAGPVRNPTTERVAEWAQGLEARGIALVPVSAIANPAP